MWSAQTHTSRRRRSDRTSRESASRAESSLRGLRSPCATKSIRQSRRVLLGSARACGQPVARRAHFRDETNGERLSGARRNGDAPLRAFQPAHQRCLPCVIRSPENVPIQNCLSNASTIVALLNVGIAGLSATSVSFIVFGSIASA